MTSRKSNLGSKRSAADPAVTNMSSKIMKMPVASIAGSDFSDSTAGDSYLRLLQEGTDCDVTFLVGSSKERIQSHQLFLKARSPVFQTMFSQRWIETDDIVIPDIDPQTFRAFLEFLYADQFVSTVSDAVKLLNVANKYQVQRLINNIEKMIAKEMKLKHSISAFQAARIIENKKIMKFADDVIAAAESLEVLARDDIIEEMDEQTLTHLLEKDEIRAKELDLFNIAIKWGELQVREERARTLKGALAGVIPLIRFPLMAPSEFASVVAPTKVLGQDDLIQLLLYFASDYCAQLRNSL